MITQQCFTIAIWNTVVFLVSLKYRAIITVKSLKSKKMKLALTLFYYVNRKIRLGKSKKLISIDQSRFHICHTRENSKMFNITSKYFSFFNNKPPASWVAQITRDFLICYSCSYYSSMIVLIFRNLPSSVEHLRIAAELSKVSPLNIIILPRRRFIMIKVDSRKKINKDRFWLFRSQCNLSIPPENIWKP